MYYRYGSAGDTVRICKDTNVTIGADFHSRAWNPCLCSLRWTQWLAHLSNGNYYLIMWGIIYCDNDDIIMYWSSIGQHMVSYDFWLAPPEQRIIYWQNRETANIGRVGSVGRASARQSGSRRFKSRSSKFVFVHPKFIKKLLEQRLRYSFCSVWTKTIFFLHWLGSFLSLWPFSLNIFLFHGLLRISIMRLATA